MLNGDDNQALIASAPGTLMGVYFRRFWTPFMTSQELPDCDGAPVRVTLMNESLVAFRDTEGTVGLLDAYCAHRGSPLFYGRNEECGLRCVYHGWKYDHSGACIDMPSEPAGSTFKDRISMTAYPTQESGGLIWAYLGPPDLAPELPDLEWRFVPETHRYTVKYIVDANYLQAMEGDDDTSHVSFLHSTLDDEMDASPHHRSSSLTKYWIKGKNPRLFVDETDWGLLTGAQRPAGEDAYYWRITPWIAPYYSLIPQEPGNPILCNIRVPVDDEHSLHFRIMAHPDRALTDAELDGYRNDGTAYPAMLPGTHRTQANVDNDYLIDRTAQKTATYTGITGIPIQDRAVTERMRPYGGMQGVADRSQEHLGTSDITIIKMRRRLLRDARLLGEGVEPFGPSNPTAYRLRPPAITLPRDVPFRQGAQKYLTAQSW